MPKRFAHYRPHPKDINDEIWAEALIVPDTNILLHLYRLGAEERSNLLKIFSAEKIQDRLWFPHQVAKEFFRNRRGVISDQHNIARDAETHIKKAFEELEKKLRHGKRSHPYFHLDEWIKKQEELRDGFLAELKAAREAWPASLKEDIYLESIEMLMEGRVGDEPGGEKYSAWEGEAKKRAERGENFPGFCDFKDQGKQKGSDKGLGDFFVWMEMQERAKVDVKHVIFVTDDGKDDWWETHEGQKLGPHPEYRLEWTRTTKSEFVMCRLERFLAWANEYISEKVDTGDLTGLLNAVRSVQAHSTTEASSVLNAQIPHFLSSLRKSWELQRRLEERRKTLMRWGHFPLPSSLPRTKDDKLDLSLSETLDRIAEENISGELKREFERSIRALDSVVTNPQFPDKDYLKEWFFENFEDPANSVPFESAEGGYLYINGGPSDAGEEIREAFPEADQGVLRAAVREIESQGMEWVRKGLY